MKMKGGRMLVVAAEEAASACCLDQPELRTAPPSRNGRAPAFRAPVVATSLQDERGHSVVRAFPRDLFEAGFACTLGLLPTPPLPRCRQSVFLQPVPDGGNAEAKDIGQILQ